MSKEYRRNIDVRSSVQDSEIVLLYDGFEEATTWTAGGTAATKSVTRVTTEYQANGIYNLQVLNASDPLVDATTINASRYFAYPGSDMIRLSFFAGGIGSEACDLFCAFIRIFDSVKVHTFGLGADYNNDRLKLYGSGGSWANVSTTAVKLTMGVPNLFVVTYNLNTDYYLSCRINALSFDISDTAGYSASDTSAMESTITLEVLQAGVDPAAGALYDDVLIQAY